MSWNLDNFWISLHEWATHGHVERLQRFPTDQPTEVDALDGGRTFLHCAAAGGQADCVIMLLAAGASIEAATHKEGRTALHLAAAAGDAESLQALVAAGASVAAADGHGCTALHLAATKGHVACLRLLLARRASVAAASRQGWTPLHVAAMKGHTACIQELLAGGASPEAVNSTGKTPRDLAQAAGQHEAARLLEEALGKSLPQGQTHQLHQHPAPRMMCRGCNPTQCLRC
jgi:ankyrin repeat protein